MNEGLKMKVKVYKSYGLLTHEKVPYYSFGRPATEIYDILSLDIPNVIGANETGEPLLDIDGRTYLLNEVITNHGDKPAIAWVDGKTRQLKILYEAD